MKNFALYNVLSNVLETTSPENVKSFPLKEAPGSTRVEASIILAPIAPFCQYGSPGLSAYALKLGCKVMVFAF